jgi:putative ABC transport system permease protein
MIPLSVPFNLAKKNVLRKRERSFLTIIGVMLAVACFIALLSIAEGLYHRINDEVNGRAVDLYVMPKSAVSLPAGSMGSFGLSTDVMPTSLLEEMQNLKNVDLCSGISYVQINVGNQGIFVLGINARDFIRFFPRFKLTEGKFYSKGYQMVVGNKISKSFELTPGKKFMLGGKPFAVTGVGEMGGGFQDYFCYVPLNSMLEIQRSRGVKQIWMQVKDKELIDQTSSKIERAYPAIAARSKEQYSGSASEFIKYAWLLQFAIASIGVLISMTASMNTMLMSTYERMKEFGTLRAIGASRLLVSTMILMESIILSLVGGSAGILIGAGGSRLLDIAVKALFQLSFPLAQVTPALIFYALLLSLGIGIVGAIIPGIVVYRKNIIDSLRGE